MPSDGDLQPSAEPSEGNGRLAAQRGAADPTFDLSEEEEEEEEEDPRSGSRLHIIVAGLIATCVIVAVLIGVFARGGGSTLTPGKSVPGTKAALRLFEGVPQHGLALGEPGAPVTLIELADLQCPTCSQFAQTTLPTLISSDVRQGLLRIVFKPVDVLGEESQSAAQIAVALSEQQRMWPFIDLMYANQGIANSGYVTSTYLRALAQAIPGADIRRALAAAHSAAVDAIVARASAEASRMRAKPGPIFLLSRTGGKPKRFIPVSVLEAAAFTKPIEALLSRGGAATRGPR